MSETEHNIGKLTPVAKIEDGQTEEEFVKGYMIGQGYTEVPTWCEDWHDYFRETFTEEKFYCNGVVYFVEYRNAEYEDIFYAEKNADGSISFTTKFYNGGCGFDEALGYAMESMNE